MRSRYDCVSVDDLGHQQSTTHICFTKYFFEEPTVESRQHQNSILCLLIEGIARNEVVLPNIRLSHQHLLRDSSDFLQANDVSTRILYHFENMLHSCFGNVIKPYIVGHNSDGFVTCDTLCHYRHPHIVRICKTGYLVKCVWNCLWLCKIQRNLGCCWRVVIIVNCATNKFGHYWRHKVLNFLLHFGHFKTSLFLIR